MMLNFMVIWVLCVGSEKCSDLIASVVCGRDGELISLDSKKVL